MMDTVREYYVGQIHIVQPALSSLAGLYLSRAMAETEVIFL